MTETDVITEAISLPSEGLETSSETFWRQLDIVPMDKLALIEPTMIGVGGLGSPTAMGLAKMGIKKFTIYDHDIVDEHNAPNQMYSLRDIGKAKVDAITDTIESMGGVVDKQQKKYRGQSLSGVVIVTVDNMITRSRVWKKIKNDENVPLLIDARMGAEEGRVFAIDPNNANHVELYESTLYSDDEAVELPCSAQAVIYNTLLIASVICRMIKGFATGEKLPREVTTDSIMYALYTR